MTTELFIGPINLSSYLYGQNKLISNAKLAGMDLELERDLWRVLHPERYVEDTFLFYTQNRNPTLYRTGEPVSWIGGTKYLGDGRLRLGIWWKIAYRQYKKDYFFLIKQDTEWWQPTKPQRRGLTKSKQKTMF